MEGQRTGSAYQGKVTLSQKMGIFWKIIKKVVRMLFLSISRESIGILTILRHKGLRSTPPSRGIRLILRLKMVENQ